MREKTNLPFLGCSCKGIRRRYVFSVFYDRLAGVG
jgi:hypothetical protein